MLSEFLKLKIDFDNVLNKIPLASPILLHTDIAKIGLLKGIKNYDSIIESYSEFFENSLTNRTFLIPTFNYDFDKSRIFDLRTDLGQVGAFSKYYSKKFPNLRTRTPIFNFVIKNNFEKFKLDPRDNCFGEGSTFDTLKLKDGYVMMIGNNRNTFVHYIEEVFSVGYRYTKKFNGIVKYNNISQDVNLHFKVRPRNNVVIYNEQDLIEGQREGVISKSSFGNTEIMWYKANTYFDFIVNRLQKDEYYLLDDDSKAKIKELSTLFGYPFRFEKIEFKP